MFNFWASRVFSGSNLSLAGRSLDIYNFKTFRHLFYHNSFVSITVGEREEKWISSRPLCNLAWEFHLKILLWEHLPASRRKVMDFSNSREGTSLQSWYLVICQLIFKKKELELVCCLTLQKCWSLRLMKNKRSCGQFSPPKVHVECP